MVAKEAIKHAPVDDKVKKGVGAGADAVKDQAEADPNAGMGERLALGVSKSVIKRNVDVIYVATRETHHIQ